MDQVTLVALPIEEGRLFVEHLNREGFPVTVAAWVKESNGPWFLYLVTPLVNENSGKKLVYRRMHEAAPEMQKDFALDPLEVKVIGPDNPVAQAMLTAGEKRPSKLPIWSYRGNSFGPLEIEGAYLYPVTRAS